MTRECVRACRQTRLLFSFSLFETHFFSVGWSFSHLFALFRPKKKEKLFRRSLNCNGLEIEQINSNWKIECATATGQHYSLYANFASSSFDESQSIRYEVQCVAILIGANSTFTALLYVCSLAHAFSSNFVFEREHTGNPNVNCPNILYLEICPRSRLVEIHHIGYKK